MHSSFPSSIQQFFDQRPHVSRETFSRLEQFVTLLLTWNRSINLIGRSTEADVWQRHIIDSMQLYDYFPADTDSITDLGSGAGFPGIVLAMLSAVPTHLIESDKKKAAFLREAARMASPLPITIHNDRIESITAAWQSDVVTARALAPFSTLFTLAAPWMKKTSCGLFLKGSNVKKELEDARRDWDFTATLYPSKVSDKEEGWVVKVEGLTRLS